MQLPFTELQRGDAYEAMLAPRQIVQLPVCLAAICCPSSFLLSWQRFGSPAGQTSQYQGSTLIGCFVRHILGSMSVL